VKREEERMKWEKKICFLTGWATASFTWRGQLHGVGVAYEWR
jgi:hypothetical protein